MTTMNEEGERTCPLCAEEMDLTDLQLKPCKCGYEICVWCWHHLIDMAEKDDTEGRCPACRTPYDKEKIVGTAANCERLVAEINSERKLKSQKAKPKMSEGRKHLNSVRVIQRNLVYVIGIPANLADEDTLERKEYFGQYGKVLKVSVTRPTGVGQHSSNSNTVSVYITYTKEEEAVRCIQSVHGFTLEGRTLRACFGTTKYCHTWLRNMHCTNPDCLYLHEVGTQEDSFTKDEILSAYERVQQITGVSNSSQKRSGNFLPPPADDFCNTGTASSAKPIVKSPSNNPTTQVKVSPPNSSSGSSGVLPTTDSWALRVSNCRPPPSTMCLNGPAKQKANMISSSSGFPLMAPRTTLPHLYTESGKTSKVTERIFGHDRSEATESSKQLLNRVGQASDTSTEIIVESSCVTSDLQSSNSYTAPARKDGNMIVQPDVRSLNNQLGRELQTSVSNHVSTGSLGRPFTDLHLSYPGNGFDTIEDSGFLTSDIAAVRSKSEFISRETSIQSSDLLSRVSSGGPMEDDEVLLSGGSSYLPYSNGQYVQPSNNGSTSHSDDRIVNRGHQDLLPFATGVSNGYSENRFSTSASELGRCFRSTASSDLLSSGEREKCLKRADGDASEIDQSANLDIESSIISSILSLDLDSLDDPLTSSDNLAKMISESDRQNGSIGLPSPWKVQSSNQSRFSFARQEDFMNQANDSDPLFSSHIEYAQKRCSSQQDFGENRSLYGDKLQNGFTVGGSYEVSDSNGQSALPSNKFPVSRVQMSAPPGFSVPSRAPPPGFSPQERVHGRFDLASSGNQMLEDTLIRNQSLLPIGNRSNSEVEFVDPAILAIGKGWPPHGLNNSTYTPQLDMFEIDPRLRLFSQQEQPLSMHQNLQYSHDMDVSHLNDSYIPSRILEQVEGHTHSQFAQMSLLQSRRSSHSSNGQQDNSWNVVQNGNEIGGMAEFLRNERRGFNRYSPGNEELNYQYRSSGNVFNRRTFGM